MIDCSKYINFQKEKQRLTKNCTIGCYSCPFHCTKNDKGVNCTVLMTSYPEVAVKILQQWSEENPATTYLDVFKKSFPFHQINSDGSPRCCVNDIFGPVAKCSNFSNCKDCWLSAYEEKDSIQFEDEEEETYVDDLPF